MHVEELGAGDPEVAVVGGIHGDEPCGVHAVERLATEAPAVDRPVALVVANEEAVGLRRRYVDVDLNRVFPGDHEAGAHETRLAAELADLLADCETLALHSTQSYEGTFALVSGVDDYVRRICPRLSVDAVVETDAADEGRIFTSVPRTIEVECGFQGSPEAAENAYRLSREFLAATGALPDEEAPRRSDLPVFALDGPIEKREADTYEVYVENFEEVAAGEAFAAMDDEQLVAEEPFHPVLLSPRGYENVFGYRARRVGSLEAE